MKSGIPLILVMLLFAQISFAQHAVVGTWEWQYSLTQTGETITPDTAGHTRQLFFGDEPDREFREFFDESVHVTGSWGLSNILVGDACYELIGAWNGSGDFIVEGVGLFTDADTMVVSGMVEEHYIRRAAVPNEQGAWGDIKRVYR